MLTNTTITSIYHWCSCIKVASIKFILDPHLQLNLEGVCVVLLLHHQSLQKNIKRFRSLKDRVSRDAFVICHWFRSLRINADVDAWLLGLPQRSRNREYVHGSYNRSGPVCMNSLKWILLYLLPLPAVFSQTGSLLIRPALLRIGNWDYKWQPVTTTLLIPDDSQKTSTLLQMTD